MSNDLLEGQSIADMLSRWYEGGTREQMCDEAFAQIRKLERELAAVRHDLERATANHSADLNDKRLPESGMALSMRASLTLGEATVRDLRALSHILAGSDDRELVQHAADLIEVLAKPTAPSANQVYVEFFEASEALRLLPWFKDGRNQAERDAASERLERAHDAVAATRTDRTGPNG